MSKRLWMILAGCALLTVPLVASAQQASTFTVVAEWAIPRAHWAEYQAYDEKNVKPIFDKMLANGTILGYGFYTTAVHDESGITHGSWYEVPSFAAIEKVQTELLKISTTPILSSATKHRDYILRARVRQGKAASGSNGYLWVNATLLQPGKFEDWRKIWEQYNKPLFDELVASGAFILYEVETEQIHTDNPNWVYAVYFAPNADGIDKFLQAVAARTAKWTPEQTRAFEEALAGITVAGSHRDFFAHVTSYAQK